MRRLSLQAALVVGCGFAESAASGDVFNTNAGIPGSPAAPMIDGAADPCRDDPLPATITLFAAIERALCEGPKTRSSWASIKAAAAVVGESKAAYLPALGASAQLLHQHNSVDVTGAPELRSDYTERVTVETLTLGWVLYDFGGRAASLDNSRELLLAALANQNATLQAVFASVARDYYAVQAAAAQIVSTRRIEAAAQQSLETAGARVARGVAAITDQLQADTAAIQAVYERVKAEDEYQTAVGMLAVDMSLSPDEPLTIPELETGALPDTRFMRAVHDLIAEVSHTHPKVQVAEAQWQAALANVRVVRAQGLPTIQLAAEADRSNQPVSASLGQPELPALTRQAYIGLKIQVPLFEGFGRGYQIRQAEAQAAVQEQAVRDAEQQVAIGVWASFQTLKTTTDNLRGTEAVLRSAEKSFDVAQHRYQSGVGNILELLSVQNTLANAELQRIQAQLAWRTARLQLAASLGALGMADLQ